MLDLEWTEPARSDLLASIDYISDDSPDAAQRLKDDIEAKAAKRPEFPRLHRPGRVEGTREMVVWANYVVVYSETPIRGKHPTCAACGPAVATGP